MNNSNGFQKKGMINMQIIFSNKYGRNIVTNFDTRLTAGDLSKIKMFGQGIINGVVVRYDKSSGEFYIDDHFYKYPVLAVYLPSTNTFQVFDLNIDVALKNI